MVIVVVVEEEEEKLGMFCGMIDNDDDDGENFDDGFLSKDKASHRACFAMLISV